MESIEQRMARLVPVPAADAHKYSRGKAVVVAGAAAYPGAACLAAQASQFAGAGYTQVFTASENVSLLQMRRPSLVVAPFSAFSPQGAVVPGNPGAVVVGPGFVAGDVSLDAIVRSAIEGVRVPLLIDGGALAGVADPVARAALRDRHERGIATVLTPHEGEARRLAASLREEGSVEGIADGASAAVDADADKAADRVSFACWLARSYGALVVLKGPDTVVVTPDGRAETLSAGTPALAKAGTGDVLAGLIGGLLAQGMDAYDAAVLGVWLHAQAGIVASERFGVVSCCAEEVLESLPTAIMRTLP